MNYLGDAGGVNPPETSPCGNCWFGDSRTYPRRNGGGCGNEQRITIEGLENINRTLSALGALIENMAISLGIEIKGGTLFSHISMHYRAMGEGPVKVMEHKPAMGGSQTGISSEIQEHGG